MRYLCVLSLRRVLTRLLITLTGDLGMSATRVAVIGAGAAGLAAARHLLVNNFECHVFERDEHVGGTWRLSEHVGVDQHGLPVHSSMYKNLRVNIPKEIMFFPDFPVPNVPESYPSWQLVLKYLEDYADHFDLKPHIKFSHLVTRVRPVLNRWELEVTDLNTKDVNTHVFDAVMVCNGHYSDPIVPEINGVKQFEGTVMHSHDYREPQTFSGQCVLVVGSGPSALDLTMELAECARQVVLSHHSSQLSAEFPGNVRQVPDVERLTSRGAVFKDGNQADLDSIIFCTGYRYIFPFLDPTCGVHVTERGVEPLYRHLVHLERTSMCFPGLMNSVVPFPLVDLQARYFVRVLNGSLRLPSLEEMRADTERDLEMRRAEGLLGTKRSHFLGAKQRAYFDLLAHEAGIEPVPPVISTLHAENSRSRAKSLYGYRHARYKIVDRDTFERVE